ncbi:MAG: barstar family protein [Enterobacterales bacterium endosymbiont of Blomia tropicalis]|uniref:barstar family protein n=1 Tax=Mixta mediterraneensis TaxID=2758443 RepID=UPI0018754146|nr:barstar family protein [Mixta mediterraneensis]MBE5251577.1 barstar family protein [Mixta mediterraneensis]MDL4915065.1 barstar family protein [Mixta mediterraneensis]
MLILTFDFCQLADRDAFYHQLAQQSHCPFPFGNNLDALWDWLTGGMALPAEIHLHHIDKQRDALVPVLALLEEAAQSLKGELRLVIH